MEITGRYATAICYAEIIEDEAREQIQRMCDYLCTTSSLQSLAVCYNVSNKFTRKELDRMQNRAIIDTTRHAFFVRNHAFGASYPSQERRNFLP